MKKMMKLAVLALVLLVTLSAGSALAATADLTVSATVNDACQITGGTLAFGVLDPLNAVDVTMNSTGVTVTCTTGVVYTIADNKAGVYAMTGPDSIDYSLTYPALNPGDGSAQSIAIQGDIAAADYATKPAGVYNDTVQLTVTP